MSFDFWIGLIVGSVIMPISLWLIKPDWFRRKVGLEPKEPYHLEAISGPKFENDPEIKPILPQIDGQWVSIQEEELQIKERKGYTFVLTKDGRKMVYILKHANGIETHFLMWKP